jgi:hypothetical protein
LPQTVSGEFSLVPDPASDFWINCVPRYIYFPPAFACYL